MELTQGLFISSPHSWGTNSTDIAHAQRSHTDSKTYFSYLGDRQTDDKQRETDRQRHTEGESKAQSRYSQNTVREGIVRTLLECQSVSFQGLWSTVPCFSQFSWNFQPQTLKLIVQLFCFYDPYDVQKNCYVNIFNTPRHSVCLTLINASAPICLFDSRDQSMWRAQPSFSPVTWRWDWPQHPAAPEWCRADKCGRLFPVEMTVSGITYNTAKT